MLASQDDNAKRSRTTRRSALSDISNKIVAQLQDVSKKVVKKRRLSVSCTNALVFILFFEI